MRTMYIILLLMISWGVDAQLQNITVNETETALGFKEYYTKAIILRFNDSQINTTVTMDSNGMMEEAWKRYERTVEIGELERVPRNGTTDAMVEMASRKIWERTGGKLVTNVATIIGPKVGASFGRYLGGAIGIACGTFFPPLQIPLVIGGVFVGGNLGRVLGFVGGQIAANVVNSMIADKIISPQLKKEVEEVLKKWLHESAHSTDVRCRSDICGVGYAEEKCKCKQCWKSSEYSDKSGLPTCKHCTSGTKPQRCNSYIAANCKCQQCSRGFYGADGSGCTLCRKEMEYSDKAGQSACKNCEVGTFPYECSDNYGNCGCRSCPSGKIGTSKGECVECKGSMEYSDSDGAAQCKKCAIGTIPYECSNNYGHCGCRKCPEGKVGTSGGQCRECKAAAEYNDIEGATQCKTCAQGSYTSVCGTNYGHCTCKKCSAGKYGSKDRACILCNGVMEYSNAEGSTACKKCSLGTIPQRCSGNYGNCGCRKCSAGKYGTETGSCELCDGAMEYGNTEGATSCKKCNVGSIPIRCYSSRGHCRCGKCSAGRFGTEKGTCDICDGIMEYSDTEGSTRCKKCSLGSIPERCYSTYGHCGCRNCSAGTIGTGKGICKLCDGKMEYSDSKGSTSCKTCALGSVPYNCVGKSGHCGCRVCNKGSYGNSGGVCVLCKGAMEYSDAKGATACKTCPSGSQAYRCSFNYGNCGCRKK